MSYSGVICDYYTVFPTNDDVVNIGRGESTFYIPASAYLSTRKGQYCLISLADGCIDKETVEEPYLISLKNVINNSSETAVLGSFQVSAQQGGTRHHHTFVKNDVKYLINARPSQLTVVAEQADAANTKLVINSGYLTFKFEYLSKEAVAALNDESEYTTF